MAAAVAAALLAGGALLGSAEAQDRVVPAAAAVTEARTAGPSTEEGLAADVMGCDKDTGTSRAPALFDHGRMKLSPFAEVTLPVSGNINWRISPFRHPTWETRFRDLRWLNPLIEAALAPGTTSAVRTAYLTRVRTIIQDWVRDNPRNARNPLPFTWSPPSAVALRASFLMCAKRAFGDAAWLDNAIREHGRQLTKKWAGSWNHGTMEAITLYRIGCSSGDPQSRRTGRSRLVASFKPGGVGPVLDGQGGTNEQSVGYADFVYKLWNEAMRLMRSCGDPVPAVMRARVAKIPEFLAAATQPDGNLVQIGDTFARRAVAIPGTPAQYAVTQGQAGPRPTQRVWVYRRGYVFGHSGWGEQRPFGQESFYSLRFGEKNRVHGHDDHMSLTYYAKGRPMIVDGGHAGYKPGAHRNYLISAAAHNVLEVVGAKFTNVLTRLDRKTVRGNWQSFTMSDRAYGVERTRNVLFAQGPDIAVVFDRTSAARQQRAFRQLWHLRADMRVRKAANGALVATPRTGNARLWMIPVPIGGERASTAVVTGRTQPRQGWVSEKMLEQTPAPVVTMTERGRSADLLTVLVPTTDSGPVRTSIRNAGGGARVLTVTVDGTAHRFRIGASGVLSRI